MKELLAEDLVGWVFRLAIMLGFTLAVHYYLSRRHYYQLARKIPGPTGLPLIGHAFWFIRGINRLRRKVWNAQGINCNIIKLWMGYRLFVFISTPEDVELILSNPSHIDKTGESEFYKPWLGDGVVTVSGCKWKAFRKVIAPIFHTNIMKSFIPIMNSNSSSLVHELQSVVGKEFNCYEYMSQVTLATLFEAVTGVTDPSERQIYENALRKMRKLVSKRQTNLWLYPDVIFNFTKHARLQKKLLNDIHNITSQAIKNRKNQYVKHGNRLPNVNLLEDVNANVQVNIDNNYDLNNLENEPVLDNRTLTMLDLMIDTCENGVILMDTEIQNQVDTIMFEGYETIAKTSSIFLFVMADRPDIQEKCLQELKGIFGNSERSVTFEDALEMKYIERCLMETLRLFPPIPIIVRNIQQDIKLVTRNLTIPAGCTVVTDIDNLHRRKDIYSNPLVFDPDNFLLENLASRHYYSYIPFSAGPRSCMGRRFSILCLKVLLATILRKFEILPGKNFRKDWASQTDRILKKRKSRFGVQLHPRIG